MVARTEGALEVKWNLTHVIDGFHGNEHTLPITPLYKDVLEMFAQAGIAETPTLIVNYGGPFGENYFYESTNVHDDAKLNHFTPPRIIHEKTKPREGAFRKDQEPFPTLAAQKAQLPPAPGAVAGGTPRPLTGFAY